MSDNPKYTRAQLEEQRQRQIRAERQRQEAEERRRREEAARRERERRMAAMLSALEADLATAQGEVTSSGMYDGDRTRLGNDLAAVGRALRAASDESEFVAQTLVLDRVRMAIVEAASRKRRDDEERQRQEESRRLQTDLDDLERRLHAIGEADSRKFDAGGRGRLASTVQRATQVLQARDLGQAAAAVREARQLLEAHRGEVLTARERWKRAKGAAEAALARMETQVAGLLADRVVTRWQKDAVDALDRDVTALRERIAQEAFGSVVAEEARAQARE